MRPLFCRPMLRIAKCGDHPMKKQINDMALAAKNSETLREELIRQQEQSILRTASLASFRFVTKSDDEWSVALWAFSNAIDRYTRERGDFLPFARTVIRRSLIDEHRRRSKEENEVSLSPFVLDGQLEDDAPEMERSAYRAAAEHSIMESDRSLPEEIQAVNEELTLYGFRFFDLTECSPRQARSKSECAKAIRYLLAHPMLMQELRRSKKLPISPLAKGSGVSRKTLDRYRKYLIMAAVVLDGDYPALSAYLRFVKKEVE